MDLLVASHLITPFVQNPDGIVHIHWIPRAPKTFVSIYEEIIRLLLLRKYFAEDRAHSILYHCPSFMAKISFSKLERKCFARFYRYLQFQSKVTITEKTMDKRLKSKVPLCE